MSSPDPSKYISKSNKQINNNSTSNYPNQKNLGRFCFLLSLQYYYTHINGYDENEAPEAIMKCHPRWPRG